MIIWNRILATVDEHERSLDAVHYLASVLGGSDTCQVALLSVHQPPQADTIPDQEQRAQAGAMEEGLLMGRLEQARRILLEAAIPAANLSTHLIPAQGRPVAEVILEHQAGNGYGTIVLGRRGVSKTEEFLFGSVSSMVMHKARDCAVWIIS
ncbi:MAG: universal stress protein [Desulfarculaceae bacterium]|nr:universal stress protein [Desulfarculaceae bacterium]MCF8073094.1 universal stress protein [Desulfarculaceae bacterium]MCF8101821.1 universal stress protein [Desulfarculaceae bacterium]MCF8115348.1 universal stress protein [Desulfarculaceae bacterium]